MNYSTLLNEKPMYARMIKKLPALLWIPTVHYRIHKNHMNLAHILIHSHYSSVLSSVGRVAQSV
jgi:hypothetical protein